MKNTHQTKFLPTVGGALLLTLTVLAPFKFGSLIGVPEADPAAPRLAIEWMLTVWPSLLFAVGSGVGLLFALAAWPPRWTAWRQPLWINAGLWALVTLAGLVGTIRATNWDFPLVEIIHIFGVFNYLLAVTLWLNRRPEAARLLLGAVTCAVGVVVAEGIYQYCFGFAEMREFVLRQEALNGPFPADYRGRLLDTRIMAGFTSGNSLSGFLLLALPPALVLIWRWSKRFEPARVACPLFTGLFGLAGVLVFLGTKSRAAFLALIVAAVCYGFFKLRSRRWRVILLATALVVVVAGAWYIAVAGRGFSSMTVRVDYYVVSLRLLNDDPLTGAGWGGFFDRYMATKVFDIDEASHDPHSMVMSFAGQCGIFGLLAIVSALGFVLYAGWRICRHEPHNWQKQALWFGWIAFAVHGMVELHLQSVGTLAPALALGAVLLTGSRAASGDGGRPTRILFAVAAVISALVGIVGGAYWVRGEYAYSALIAALGERAPQATVLRVYEAARAARPRSPYPPQQLAEYYFKQGRLVEAERYFRLALELAPERSMYFGRLAEIRRRLGDAEGSRALAREALKRNPGTEKYRLMSEAP